MSNQSEDIQAAGSDTRPPMLDRTDFESWQQRIRICYKDTDQWRVHLQSIDEGPFKMGRCRDEIASGTDAPYLGLERDRVGLPRDIYKLINHNTDAKDIWDNVKMLLEGSELTKDDRESQLYDEFEHFRQHKVYALPNGKHESHANENKMLMERLNQHSHDPLALVSNVSPYQYPSSSSVPPQPSYISPVTYQPQFADNTPLNTVQNGRVMVQNVQGRQNRVQGNNARGAIAARNEGAQNRAGNANAGQENPIKCYNYNGICHIARNCNQPKRPQNSDYFKEKMLLMWDNKYFDDDVDEGTKFRYGSQEDNIFIYEKVGPLHDSDTLFEVQDHDNGLDNVNESHEEHKMHNVVQQNDDNEDRVVYSDVSSVPNDAIMIITNDIYEQDTQCVTFEMPNIPINASLTAELV
ncbi:hypothetical protein Tco_1493725 [Tanacetum coccineum]